MNLFGFNIQVSRAASAAAGPVQRSFDADAWLKGDDIGSSGPALSNAYEQVVWVYRAINVLAEQVANIPFLFSAGERGKENLITSGPLLDFYDRPHPQLNRFQYWELRIIWLMLRGECFRVPIYEGDDRPEPPSAPSRSASAGRRRLRQVLMLDPARFQHIVEDHRLIGWRYTGFGPQAPLASQVFLPEEVWFEKLPNPFDFWRGFSPLLVAGMAARTDFAAGLFMRGIIENNADTGVIVRTDKWLSPEQGDQIIAALKNRKRGAGVADRPVLLPGSAEVIKPQLSSTDLQFLENRKFSRAEICAAFGVPEEVVSSTDHAKYDVMAGARLNFIENRVAPLCRRLEAAEDVTVKAIDPGASGWFDLDSLPILQEARRNRLAAARTGFEMGVPLNELNRVLDLGFNPLPWGDQGFVSGALRPVGEGKKSEDRNPKSERRPKSEIRGDANDGGAVSQSREQRADESEAEARDPFARAAGLLGGLGREARSAQPSQLPIDDHVLGRLRRFAFEQRGRILGKLATATAGGEAGSAEQLIDRVFNLHEEDAALACRFEAKATGRPAPASAAGAPAVDEQAAVAEPATRFNKAMRAALLDTLGAGLAAGEGAPALAARVKSCYNHNSGAIVATAAAELARLTPARTPTAAFVPTP